MPHEGYAYPIMNDEPGFHSDVSISELTERVAQAIEASDVSSAHLVAKTMDRVTHGTRPTPTEPNGVEGLRSPNTNLGGPLASPRWRFYGYGSMLGSDEKVEMTLSASEWVRQRPLGLIYVFSLGFVQHEAATSPS